MIKFKYCIIIYLVNINKFYFSRIENIEANSVMVITDMKIDIVLLLLYSSTDMHKSVHE